MLIKLDIKSELLSLCEIIDNKECMSTAYQCKIFTVVKNMQLTICLIIEKLSN